MLRDGRYVETMPAAEATVERLIASMVGRAVETIYRAQRRVGGTDEVALRPYASSAASRRAVPAFV